MAMKKIKELFMKFWSDHDEFGGTMDFNCLPEFSQKMRIDYVFDLCFDFFDLHRGPMYDTDLELLALEISTKVVGLESFQGEEAVSYLIDIWDALKD